MNSFSNTSRTVAIVTSVVGGIVLLGVGSTAALATIGTATSGSSARTQSIDVSSIAGVDIESNAAHFELVFGDVSEATLEVAGEGRARWDLRVDDGDLVVRSQRSIFSWCIGWCNFGEQRVTLTLPESLDTGKLDADFEVNAGSLTAGGSWRDLGMDLAAGELNFDGSALTIDTSVSAGSADIVVDGTKTADLDVSAGELIAEITGRAPSDVSVEVSAGKIELTVPDVRYEVVSEASAGSIDNRLDTANRSANRIDVSVSAGSAVLRAK